MSEPTRDELAAAYSGQRDDPEYHAFQAGWDAALEQLSRPDIIEAAARGIWMLDADNGDTDPVSDGYYEPAQGALAEVVRVLSDRETK